MNGQFDFATLLIDGIPLVLVVFALVEFTKSFGLKGKWLTATSLLIGLFFGIGHRFTMGLPVDFAGWYSLVVYGLALGLMASGFYDFLDKRIQRNFPG